jgi:hypothetical protein
MKHNTRKHNTSRDIARNDVFTLTSHIVYNRTFRDADGKPLDVDMIRLALSGGAVEIPATVEAVNNLIEQFDQIREYLVSLADEVALEAEAVEAEDEGDGDGFNEANAAYREAIGARR